MGTNIRPELSVNNKYWISKHRFYELKHFCLQYPEWKEAYKYTIEECLPHGWRMNEVKGSLSDPTGELAILKSTYRDKINIIESAAKEAAPGLSDYILKAVTEGVSYNCLKTRLNLPCGKDMFYDCYRRFFWLLDKTHI